MHQFRSRSSKRSALVHASPILPSRYDDDDDEDAKYMPKLPSGALYGGCYYPTKHRKRRGALRGHLICGGVICFFIFFMIITSIFNYKKDVDLNIINGIKLKPIEEWREIELKYQQTKFHLHSEEQLKKFRERIPEWNNESNFREIINEISHDNNRQEKSIITLDSMTTSASCPDIDPSSVSTSIIYQGTLDRFWLLEEICRRWTDPIIVVIYIEGHDTGEEPWSDIFDWKERCPQSKVIPYFGGDEMRPWEYPVNKLRNIGINALDTSHFIVVDMDFVPSFQLRETIHNNLAFAYNERDALVVPAFERYGDSCEEASGCKDIVRRDPSFIPSTFDDLTQCIKEENCGVFQSNINWTGHYSTRSELWLEKEWLKNERPRNIPCFESDRYEPYVVLRWCESFTPFYDERFEGYGKNKIEYISNMRYLDYKFSVLAGPGFVIHVPHARSIAKESWENNEKGLHRRMDSLYKQFLIELREKFDEPKLGLC